MSFEAKTLRVKVKTNYRIPDVIPDKCDPNVKHVHKMKLLIYS